MCATILNHLRQQLSQNTADSNSRVRRDSNLQTFQITKQQFHKDIVVDDPNGCHLLKKEGQNTVNNPACIRPRFGISIQMPAINNYGCWCYGGEHWPGSRDMSGFGETVDEWDEACKAHHQGFDCISIDAEIEGETCNPNETDYLLKIAPQSDGDYILQCADEIDSTWCERRTCLVDLRFMARHWKLELEEDFPDYESFGHAGYHGLSEIEGFDPSESCQLPATTRGTPAPYWNPKSNTGGRTSGPDHHVTVKQCCGDYPYRLWFDKNNVHNMKCCTYEDVQVNEEYGFSIKVGQIYNDMTKQCCADGVYNIWDNQC